ncbi:MAG: transglutaminase domain-containing protein, partial [Ignavibacteria bacterium]|nr:transglutaminase domain-containing protein [Ignavibacteria bacterium]
MLKHLLRACVVLLCVSPLSAQTLTQDRTSASQPAMADTSLLDLYEFALSITLHARTDYERAEHLLNWLSHNFRWLSTDYKKRTVKEIITRRGGNCFELATVYMSLIKTLGIRYRQVAEINIHPRSERRQ